MSGEALPRARIRRRRLFRLVWIVPALAAALTAYLVWDHLRKLGPEISIRFSDASGVRAGQTPIIYRGVPVGEVIDVALTPDRGQALVRARLHKPRRSHPKVHCSGSCGRRWASTR